MKKLLPILIFILYLVLFHIPVKPEFVPALLALSDVPDTASARAGEEPILPFRGSDCAGYINDKGKVIFVRLLWKK